MHLRPATSDDVSVIAALVDAQDVAWWGEPDGDDDDVRAELDAVAEVNGSLAAGARLAVTSDRAVGVALLTGHGQTTLAIDPAAAEALRARRELIAWLAGCGACDVESPVQDRGRLADLAAAGFEPHRSSFELERGADVSDLALPAWPDGVAPVPFRRADDADVHELIYSVWSDVRGHTDRPLDEWRARILGGPWFEAGLIVCARRDGRLAGVALGRRFGANVGWVTQLAVGRTEQGRGLGRALLTEACHRLAATGVELIALGVEADNAGALDLYRRVGFSIAREWVHTAMSGASTSR